MFSRGTTSNSATNDMVNALIAIAKDPEALQARLTELKVAEDAAKAAILEAGRGRNELNVITQAANDHAAALAQMAAQLAKDSAALELSKAAYEKVKQDFDASLAATKRDLNARENDLASRASAVEETERSTTNLNRLAQADRDAAATLRGSLEDIVSGLDALKAQIAALG